VREIARPNDTRLVDGDLPMRSARRLDGGARRPTADSAILRFKSRAVVPDAAAGPAFGPPNEMFCGEPSMTADDAHPVFFLTPPSTDKK